MGGMARFWQGQAWLQAYWSAFSVLLAVAAYALWRRGTTLALRPRLLLIDELFEGHQSTLDELARVLIDSPHPWTVVVVTHDPRVAAHCARTIEFPSQQVASHA
jgi:predicted ABC-type transport system involved in lysophospholipase L1 biosynthesis ATPase subunit